MIEAGILNRLASRLGAALAPPAVALVPLVVDGAAVGALTAPRAARLLAFDRVFRREGGALAFVPALRDPPARTRALEGVARTLAAEGALSRWRDERYAAVDAWGAPAAFLVERAAARYFGLLTFAVHVNGTVRLRDGGVAVWLARRSADKAIDPGMLDTLVGGGIAAGAGIGETLAKEAWEEAGLPAKAVALAVRGSALAIRRLQPDGLQREIIFAHDLALPEDTEPVNQDGEVVAFRRVPPREAALVAGHVAGPDVVTADAGLVIADWLCRDGHAHADGALARCVAAMRSPGPAAGAP